MSWQPLDSLPVWAFFVLTCLIVAVPVEIGYRLGRRHRDRAAADAAADSDPSVGVMVGSTLGLLAFILAFTFGMAGAHFEERRQVILEDANAIGTTYLRTQLLPEPQRAEVAALLREYVDLRLQAGLSDASAKEIAPTIARSEEIQREIWQKAMIVADEHPTVMTGLFLQALNQMIDVHSKRILFNVQTSIPSSIWLGLFVVTMAGLMAAGFQAGTGGQRRTIVILGLVLAFASVMTLIADLNHPRKGFLRSTQTPISDLQKSMGSDGR